VLEYYQSYNIAFIMDTFFSRGGLFDDDAFNDIRIPYAGEIPPLGYTLYQDSITYVHLDSNPFMYHPIYNYYPW